MKPALIVFVRNPVIGQVKTRIAKELGNETALEVYKKLLLHTRSILQPLSIDVFVYYADFINEDDLWNGAPFIKRLQQGAHFGERMKDAFKSIFDKGYDRVVIVGSDCVDLSSELVNETINNLEEINFVIGPSEDGGYYLLGSNLYYPALFDNKQWSTDTVCMDTLRDIEKTDYSVYLLPVLSDVDNAEDCNKYRSLLLT